MTSNKEKILSRIKTLVREIDPTAETILFGSRARGDEKPDSDWDILILINGRADLETEQRFRHKLFDLELEMEAAFSVFVYNNEDWNSRHWMTPFYNNIALEGISI